MKDWVKIQSFNHLHQAELRVDILKQNKIDAVIVNEQDSLFFIGNIDLYVQEEDEKKAKLLIDEFNGYAKVNSFVQNAPILLFQTLLKNKGIGSELKRRQDDRYTLDNFELYVKNEKLEEVKTFIAVELHDLWATAFKATKLRHALNIYNILANKGLTVLITKERNSEFHLKVINLFVKKEDLNSAKQIIDTLEDWEKIYENTALTETDKKEKALTPKKINTLIIFKNNNYALFVEKNKVAEANEILDMQYEWVKLKNFENINNALYYKALLKSENIQTVVVNDKDRVFLLGEIELFVKKEELEKAKEIIKDTTSN